MSVAAKTRENTARVTRDARALKNDLQSLDFAPSLAKPEIGKEVGRRRAHS